MNSKVDRIQRAQARLAKKPPLPKFFAAKWPFTCSECGDKFDEGDQLLLVEETTAKYSGNTKQTNKLCDSCGKDWLESQKTLETA